MKCFHSFLFFVLFFSNIGAANYNNQKELLYYRWLVQNNENLNSYIHSFPFEQYECCEVKDLGSFYIDNQEDNIKSHLKKGIYWEGGIGKLVKRYTLPGTVAVDFGSHIGIHTITMSRGVGPSGYVVSFEPQRKIYREQYYNLRLNNCHENVLQLPFCAGEADKIVEIVPWSGEGVNEGGAHVGHGGEKVIMLPLDRLNLHNVSCIKMDVESYELNVLKGSYKTIMRCRPVVIFEILGNHDLSQCSGQVKQQLDETIGFFTHLGYRVERIEETNDFIAHPN